LSRALGARLLKIFGDLEQRWGDGAPLIRAIPPARLERDAVTFDAGLRASSIAEQNAAFERMLIRQLFPDWHPHVFPVAILLAFLCAGRNARGEAYIQVARALMRTHVATPFTAGLVERFGRRARD
jgi:hypothetical protein